MTFTAVLPESSAETNPNISDLRPEQSLQQGSVESPVCIYEISFRHETLGDNGFANNYCRTGHLGAHSDILLEEVGIKEGWYSAAAIKCC
jgi:hypothetical protein